MRKADQTLALLIYCRKLLLVLAVFQTLNVYIDGISTLMGKSRVHGSRFIGVGEGDGVGLFIKLQGYS